VAPSVGGLETTMQGPDEETMKAKREPDKENPPKTSVKRLMPRAWNPGALNSDRQNRSNV